MYSILIRNIYYPQASTTGFKTLVSCPLAFKCKEFFLTYGMTYATYGISQVKYTTNFRSNDASKLARNFPSSLITRIYLRLNFFKWNNIFLSALTPFLILCPFISRIHTTNPSSMHTCFLNNASKLA